MISQILSVVLDVAVIGLLAATIAYAVRLERQITALREGRGEMEGLVKGFSEATAQADAGLAALRHSAEGSGVALRHLVEQGTQMRQDLEMLIQSAEAAATRLEKATAAARQPVPSQPVAAPAVNKPKLATVSSPSVSAQKSSGMAAENTATPAATPAATSAAAAPGDARSRAERELLKALETMRE